MFDALPAGMAGPSLGMRIMSFSATTDQIRNRTKTVTRRFGWWSLKKGTILMAVEKYRGVRLKDRVELATLLVVSVRMVRLSNIKKHDLIKEGFPNMSPREFVTMFCKMNRCEDWSMVTRIEFQYLTRSDTGGRVSDKKNPGARPSVQLRRQDESRKV